MMEQRAHASLSPSKRHRWALCPASPREEAKYPEEDRGGNKAAVDGTHTHTLLDTCIKSGKGATTFVGQTLKDEDGEFVVDAARAERVQFALDYIGDRLQLMQDARVISEMEVDPAPMFFRGDLKGHVDVQIVTDDYIEIIDYKDGMAVVNAEGNLQLEQYAFGALCAHQDRNFKTIRMTIIQPKLREKGMSGVVWAQTSYDALMSRIPVLAAEAAATDAPDAPFNPGEEQCKYCRAKGGCSALSSKVMEASGIKFDDLTGAAEQEPTALTDQRIREVMEAAPLIRQFLDGVEKEAQRRLEAGQSIEGLKLVHGRGSTAWAMTPDEIAERLKKMKVPKELIWKTEIVTPAAAKKLSWKDKDGNAMSLTDKQIKMLEDEYIKKSEGKLTVALLSDHRPAATINVASMFNAIDSDLPDFLKPKE